jgi:mono/diheme cytochrome c family protein
LRLAASLVLAAVPADAAPDDPDAVARGAYLARAGGCIACHTDIKGGGAPLAGGGQVETPFGTFHVPNLTPDPTHGLGRWSSADFAAAMTRGRAPNGGLYYPAFPYPAYSGMTAADLSDLWAYLRSLAPVDRADKPHDLAFPFNLRATNLGWQFLFYRPEPWRPDPGRSADWNRGAYLTEHLLHCGECHTPRNRLGAKRAALAYAGHKQGPDNSTVPNITPDAATGIGGWNTSDVVWLLQTGFMPDGDDIQGEMKLLVEHGSSHLSPDDLKAVATYILSLPAIENRVRDDPPPAAEAGGSDDEYDYDF